jgi:hypothetical protein
MFCGESKKDGMWCCSEDECTYDVCKDCIDKKEIKCTYNHLLEFDLTTFDCGYCDSGNYPCMVCPGPNCNFSICLECCVSDAKIKDKKGHPCKKDIDREKMKIVCDYCAKFKAGIVSCAKCN